MAAPIPRLADDERPPADPQADLFAPADGSFYDRLPLPKRRFVDALLTADSAAEAYREARPSVKSPGAARVGAHKFLADPYVRAALDERREVVAIAMGVEKTRILREWAAIAFQKPDDYRITANGVEKTESAPADAMRAIGKVSRTVTRKGTGANASVSVKVEYTPWSKPEALKALSKIVGLFDDVDDAADGDDETLPQMVAGVDETLPPPPPDADWSGAGGFNVPDADAEPDA